jgi:hypothetical protein
VRRKTSSFGRWIGGRSLGDELAGPIESHQALE